MIEFPWAYQKIDSTTWAYMSSLLMLAVFFKFSRFWSIRNFDLFLIILLAPGLLLYGHGVRIEKQACNNLAVYGVNEPLSLTSGGHRIRAITRPASPSPSAKVDPEQPISENDKKAEELDQKPLSVASPGSPENQKSQKKPAQDAKEDGSVAELDQQKAIQIWQQRRLWGLRLLRSSFYFLMFVSAVLLIRLLLDQIMIRKPLLGNNLSSGGMTFVLCGLLTFLVANIAVSQPVEKDLLGAKSAAKILGEEKQEGVGKVEEVLEAELGPAYPLIHLLPVLSTVIQDPNNSVTQLGSDQDPSGRSPANNAYIWVAKMMAIFSQFALVAGLIALGKYHFGSLESGIGMATLYLMLPYTAQMTGRIDHVLPSALLLWAIVLYRFPFWAGILFGLVFGLVYYPVFLLALWLSFYWEKGALRFTYGVLVMFGLLVLSLLLISTEQQPFLYNLQSTFGIRIPRLSGLKGIWELAWDPWFRLPFLVAFVSLCFSFVAWPPRKTLGTLMAYSAAAMVAAQFWHGDGGGLYMAWYLPLTLATFFRPNLNQKIATSEVK